MGTTNKTILAISGSLRDKSYNTALLQSAMQLKLENTSIRLYKGLERLPVYDPLVAEADMPDSVNDFRAHLQQADGVIISTPEYAYGIPGVLKNALDWVVASGELVMKPTAVASVSTSELGGARAHFALMTVLHAMNARLLVDASIIVPFAGSRFDSNGLLIDPLLRQSLATSIAFMEKLI